MIYRVSMDAAINAIRSAFDPFVCIVRVYDNERRLRFHVFDEQGHRLDDVVGISTRAIVEPGRLRAEIQEARIRLEEKGYKLDSLDTHKLSSA